MKWQRSRICIIHYLLVTEKNISHMMNRQQIVNIQLFRVGLRLFDLHSDEGSWATRMGFECPYQFLKDCLHSAYLYSCMEKYSTFCVYNVYLILKQTLNCSVYFILKRIPNCWWFNSVCHTITELQCKLLLCYVPAKVGLGCMPCHFDPLVTSRSAEIETERGIGLHAVALKVLPYITQPGILIIVLGE